MLQTRKRLLHQEGPPGASWQLLLASALGILLSVLSSCSSESGVVATPKRLSDTRDLQEASPRQRPRSQEVSSSLAPASPALLAGPAAPPSASLPPATPPAASIPPPPPPPPEAAPVDTAPVEADEPGQSEGAQQLSTGGSPAQGKEPTETLEPGEAGGVEEPPGSGAEAPGGADEGGAAPDASSGDEEAPASPVAPRKDSAGVEDKSREDYSSDCSLSGCHRSLKEYPAPHGQLLEKECVACHTKTGAESEHSFELTSPKESLCTSCHKELGNAKYVHKPFEGSTCLHCHDPHGGKTRSLLVSDNVGQLCAKCHEMPEDEVVHGPVVVGDCLQCHHAHKADNDHLTTAPGKDLCVRCHAEMGELLTRSPYVHGPAAVDCSACHLPHGGDDRVMLRDESKVLCLSCHDSVSEQVAKDPHIHGAMEGPNGCTACHTPHASQLKSQLKDLPVQLCLTCHDREIVNATTKKKTMNVAKEIMSAKFKHGPIQTGDCQGCHFPHSSGNTRLLKESFPEQFYMSFSDATYGLCFRCHEKTLVQDERTTTLTKFRDGDRNLHFLHVNREKGRTCRACHEIHGSDLPSHIRKSVPFGSANWPLPINFEKTETGGTCSPGCHKPKSYANGGTPEPSANLQSSTPGEPDGAAKTEEDAAATSGEPSKAAKTDEDAAATPGEPAKAAKTEEDAAATSGEPSKAAKTDEDSAAKPGEPSKAAKTDEDAAATPGEPAKAEPSVGTHPAAAPR